MVGKRKWSLLKYELPSLETRDDGDGQQTLVCPACSKSSRKLDLKRCEACNYRYQHPSGLILFVEIIGVFAIVATSSVGFVFGSDIVQGNSTMLTIKAQGLENSGKKEASVKLLWDALKKKPKDATLLSTLAGIYYTREKYDKAIEVAKAMKSTNDPLMLCSYHNLMALCYAEKGKNLDLALTHGKKAVELSAAVPMIAGSIEETLGWVYYCRGEYQKALETLKAAEKKTIFVSHMGNLERQYHLGMVYIALGEFEKGHKLLRNVVNKGNPDHSFVKRAKKALALTASN